MIYFWIDKKKSSVYNATDENDISNSYYPIASTDMEKLKRMIAEIGYSTSVKGCAESRLSSEEIKHIALFCNMYEVEGTKEIGIFISISDSKDLIFVGYYPGIELDDHKKIFEKFCEWLKTNRKTNKYT